jgi:hypothetical protein
MKSAFLTSLLLFRIFLCSSDIRYIDFHKIDPDSQCTRQQSFLFENLHYIEFWVQDWTFDVSKDSLIRELKDCMNHYALLKKDILEVNLLEGEIAHFLYNLNQDAYWDTAEAHYRAAINIKNEDIRGYWFLGNHYAQSNEPSKAITTFETARIKAGSGTPADFWKEYAFAMLRAGMPSHCSFALDQYASKGGRGKLADAMDTIMGQNRIASSPDSACDKNLLWSGARMGPKVRFTSRLLGLRIFADSQWTVQISDFANRQAYITFQPETVEGKQGNRIGFTMLLLVKVPKPGETLDAFVESLMKKTIGARDTNSVVLDRYPESVSYTFRSNEVYGDRGGAHMHFIGIERRAPAFPGMALESEPSKLGQNPFHDRFRGRLFYLLLLDTCEDIHSASWITFMDFLKNELVIE